jgi:zinc finger FYVE domain-containing protein 26
MHMRYALQSVVLALGEMEKSVDNGTGCHYHQAVSYLREMQNFMEAIKSVPRKVGSSVICSYSGAPLCLQRQNFIP